MGVNNWCLRNQQRHNFNSISDGNANRVSGNRDTQGLGGLYHRTYSEAAGQQYEDWNLQCSKDVNVDVDVESNISENHSW